MSRIGSDSGVCLSSKQERGRESIDGMRQGFRIVSFLSARLDFQLASTLSVPPSNYQVSRGASTGQCSFRYSHNVDWSIEEWPIGGGIAWPGRWHAWNMPPFPLSFRNVTRREKIVFAVSRSFMLRRQDRYFDISSWRKKPNTLVPYNPNKLRDFSLANFQVSYNIDENK